MILNKNKVEEAAEKHAGNMWGIYKDDIAHPDLCNDLTFNDCTIKDFRAGAVYAESELSELAIEFADWIDKIGYVKDGNIWGYWDGIREWNTKYTTKELFEEFLRDRNNE